MMELRVGDRSLHFHPGETAAEWTLEVKAGPTWHADVEHHPLRAAFGSGSVCVYADVEALVVEDDGPEPAPLDLQDEIRDVYQLDGGWVIVCESSIHLVQHGRALAYQLPDVVVGSALVEHKIVLELFGAQRVTAVLSGNALELS